MNHHLTRRRFLEVSAGASVLTLGGLAACTPSPTPTSAPSPAPTTAAAPAPTKSGASAASPAAKAPAATVAPAATQAPAKQTFSPVSVKGITIDDIIDNAWWLIGKEKGFFQDFGIDVNVQGVNGGNQVIAALVGGDVNYADQSPSTMLTVAAKDPTVKTVAGTRPGLMYVIISQKSINSLRDVEGKSVGIGAPRALLDQVTRNLLTKAGVDPNKVTFASIGSTSAIYQAIVAGKIDAGMADLSSVSIAQRDGVKVLMEVWKELPGFLRGAFWVTTKTIAEKGDVIARTLAGYAKTYRYVTSPESKEVYLKIATEKLAVPREQAEFQWDFMQKNPSMLARNLELPQDAIQLAQQLNVEAGNMEKVLPFDQVSDLSLQRRALELVDRA